MFGIGMPELLLILAIALVVIGPKKLPDIARALGKAMGEFKKATSELKESMEIDQQLSDVRKSFNQLNHHEKKENGQDERKPKPAGKTEAPEEKLKETGQQPHEKKKAKQDSEAEAEIGKQDPSGESLKTAEKDNTIFETSESKREIKTDDQGFTEK